MTDRQATTRVAYVMTHHPRVATTFITNEIDEMRRRGAEIVPIAMNLPGPDDLASEASRAERSRTLYLKSAGPIGLLRSTLRVACVHPVGFLGLIVRALRSARLDLSIALRRLVHLAYASLAVEHCRAHGITHLHAHFGQAPATIAWFTAEIGNLGDGERWTWSFTIHGFQDFVNESDARLDLKAASASFVVCVSDFTRSQLCRVTDPLLWDRFHVVRCGIDLDAFSSRPPRPMPESARILVVARLSAEKGHVVLLHALARLREEGSAATLDIVGSGPYEAEIRAEVGRLGLDDAVRHHGELSPGEVDRHLRDADVFCLPSFSEGLPVSIMEAMAIGVPVVATAISGIPELAVHDETALTVPPGNEEALAAALRRMLGDAGLAETVAAAGRVAVERRHDLHTNVANLATVFESTVESPTRLTASALPRRRLFGLDFVDLPNLEPIVDELAAHVPYRREGGDRLPLVVTPNVDQVVHFDRDTDAVATALIRRAAYVLPDGQPIVWASRLLGEPLRARLAGSSLVAMLFPRLVAGGHVILVVATSDEVASRIEAEDGAVTAVLAPRLSLDDPAGIDAFAESCTARILATGPSHVFVTLGFPKQCNIIDGVIRRLEAADVPLPLFFAVGASFDMYYGLVRRAPEWMQRCGLEWFFRFLQEPKRLFRRYFVRDPGLLPIVWREKRVRPGQRSQDATPRRRELVRHRGLILTHDVAPHRHVADADGDVTGGVVTGGTLAHAGPLRAGVIGCGTIAHEHLRHLGTSPSAELVAVCDRSYVTARYAAERYGARAHHTNATEMLANHRFDVVHVLTPPHTHSDLVEAALSSGYHVVCEKPMAVDERETRRLLDVAAAARLVLVESHNLLFNDPVMAIDRLVLCGTLGAVREVDVVLQLDLSAGPFGDLNLTGPGAALPGGAVHDFAPHLAYLLLHFAGEHPRVERVVGDLANLGGNPRVGYDHLDALVDVGSVRGLLRVASDVSPPSFRLEVRGTAGSVATDLYNPFLTVRTLRDSGKRAPFGQLRSAMRIAAAAATNLRDKVRGHDTYHGLPRMLDAVYAAILRGEEPPITPEDIVATAALTDQLVSLARTPS